MDESLSRWSTFFSQLDGARQHAIADKKKESLKEAEAKRAKRK